MRKTKSASAESEIARLLPELTRELVERYAPAGARLPDDELRGLTRETQALVTHALELAARMIERRTCRPSRVILDSPPPVAVPARERLHPSLSLGRGWTT